MNNRKIYLISGAGRSGSTLLTVILDNHQDSIAVGELINYISNGIFNDEYCSCKKNVSQCFFWQKVKAKWDERRILDLEEYNRVQRAVTKNKGTLSLIRNLINPSPKFKNYIEDTKSLYNAIFETSGKSIIIDSSKPAQRILVLRKCGISFSVLHLTRRFSLVLNSNKKSFKKDLKAGLEKDMNPQKTSYVAMTWILNNILVWLFSLGGERIRIRYENIIRNLTQEINKVISKDVNFQEKLKNRGPFSSNHIVAGNRIRMKDELYVANDVQDKKLLNLTAKDKIMSKILDLY